MKKMVMVGVAAVGLSGCANMGQPNGGRYYQQTSPLSDNVIMQIDMVTDTLCKQFVALSKPEAKPFVGCSNRNLEANLPWRATGKASGLTFVFNGSSKLLCQENIDVFVGGTNGSIVQSCEER